MPRLAWIAWTLAAIGCQTVPEAPPAEEEGILRGQGPAVAESVPWGGPAYLLPGEISCDTPPPVGLGYEVVPTPTTPAEPVSTDPEAGWLDILPPDGGPISDDFGLPVEDRIANRVPNPVYVRANNPDAAWEMIAREAARYFPIQTEDRIRQTGAMLTEGRLVTRWTTGSTIFEPWRRDSAGAYNRWLSTLQTIRRRAMFRVMPAAGGYEIAVRVDKQLEDLNRPERASAGAASIRNDSALPTDRVKPIDRVRESDRWIDIGRDDALEQRILKRLQSQFAA